MTPAPFLKADKSLRVPGVGSAAGVQEGRWRVLRVLGKGQVALRGRPGPWVLGLPLPTEHVDGGGGGGSIWKPRGTLSCLVS